MKKQWVGKSTISELKQLNALGLEAANTERKKAAEFKKADARAMAAVRACENVGAAKALLLEGYTTKAKRPATTTGFATKATKAMKATPECLGHSRSRRPSIWPSYLMNALCLQPSRGDIEASDTAAAEGRVTKRMSCYYWMDLADGPPLTELEAMKVKMNEKTRDEDEKTRVEMTQHPDRVARFYELEMKAIQDEKRKTKGTKMERKATRAFKTMQRQQEAKGDEGLQDDAAGSESVLTVTAEWRATLDETVRKATEALLSRHDVEAASEETGKASPRNKRGRLHPKKNGGGRGFGIGSCVGG